MNRLCSWLLGLLLRRQTMALEVVLALQTLTWGLWVAWPFSRALSALPVYTVLHWVPEWAVGSVFVVHGLAYLRFIYRKDVHACRRGALVTAGLWSFVLGSWILTVPMAPIIAVHAIDMAAALWVYARLHLRYA